MNLKYEGESNINRNYFFSNLFVQDTKKKVSKNIFSDGLEMF